MKKTLTSACSLSVLALLALICLPFGNAQAQCGTSYYNQDNNNGYSSIHSPSSQVAPLRVTVKAQPNPAVGKVTVIVDASREFGFVPRIDLVGMDGRVVAQVTGLADVKNWEASLDLTAVNPGVYFLRTNCENCKPVQVMVAGSINP